MSANTAEVINACRRLARALETHTGALADVRELIRLLPEVEKAEEDSYRQALVEEIAAAAGDATGHDWQVVGTQIKCSRCPVVASRNVLRRGAVPPCDSANVCVSRTGGVHALLPVAVIGGGSDCIFCKAVYPATAGTREGVTS